MTGLRKLSLALLALALVFGTGVASAQSLAEVAKKEKERRKKNDEEAKRVITERDLSSGYGGLPATRASSTSSSAAKGETTAAEGEADAEEEQDETQTQEYWQNRVRAAKDKIANLEERLESEDWGGGQRANVDPRGLNNLQRRQQMEQDLATARAELAAIRDEARRAGVPPGWVR